MTSNQPGCFVPVQRKCRDADVCKWSADVGSLSTEHPSPVLPPPTPTSNMSSTTVFNIPIYVVLASPDTDGKPVSRSSVLRNELILVYSGFSSSSRLCTCWGPAG